MFAAQENRLVRTAAFGISLILHLLLFLVFPHMATFLEGTHGEAIMAGGIPIQLVTLTPVASGLTRPVEVASHGRTAQSPANQTLPAPGEPSTLPQPDRPAGVTLETSTPAPAAAPAAAPSQEAATAAERAGILPPETADRNVQLRGDLRGLPATPTSNNDLLTSPTGTDILQVPEYSAKSSAGVTESRSTSDTFTKSSTLARPAENPRESAEVTGNTPAPTSTASVAQGQTSRAGGDVRNEGTGAAGKQGISWETSASPAPSVGQGPWLAGNAPVYPKAALDRGIEGVVRGQVLISSDGQIAVRQTVSAGDPNMDIVATKTIGERWQAAYRPPAGWVTVVEWVVRFERNQVFVEQTDAFNIREEQVPATGPVTRPSIRQGATGTEGGAR